MLLRAKTFEFEWSTSGVYVRFGGFDWYYSRVNNN